MRVLTQGLLANSPTETLATFQLPTRPTEKASFSNSLFGS